MTVFMLAENAFGALDGIEALYPGLIVGAQKADQKKQSFYNKNTFLNGEFTDGAGARPALYSSFQQLLEAIYSDIKRTRGGKPLLLEPQFFGCTGCNTLDPSSGLETKAALDQVNRYPYINRSRLEELTAEVQKQVDRGAIKLNGHESARHLVADYIKWAPPQMWWHMNPLLDLTGEDKILEKGSGVENLYEEGGRPRYGSSEESTQLSWDPRRRELDLKMGVPADGNDRLMKSFAQFLTEGSSSRTVLPEFARTIGGFARDVPVADLANMESNYKDGKQQQMRFHNPQVFFIDPQKVNMEELDKLKRDVDRFYGEMDVLAAGGDPDTLKDYAEKFSKEIKKKRKQLKKVIPKEAVVSVLDSRYLFNDESESPETFKSDNFRKVYEAVNKSMRSGGKKTLARPKLDNRLFGKVPDGDRVKAGGRDEDDDDDSDRSVVSSDDTEDDDDFEKSVASADIDEDDERGRRVGSSEESDESAERAAPLAIGGDDDSEEVLGWQASVSDDGESVADIPGSKKRSLTSAADHFGTFARGAAFLGVANGVAQAILDYVIMKKRCKKDPDYKDCDQDNLKQLLLSLLWSSPGLIRLMNFDFLNSRILSHPAGRLALSNVLMGLGGFNLYASMKSLEQLEKQKESIQLARKKWEETFGKSSRLDHMDFKIIRESRKLLEQVHRQIKGQALFLPGEAFASNQGSKAPQNLHNLCLTNTNKMDAQCLCKKNDTCKKWDESVIPLSLKKSKSLKHYGEMMNRLYRNEMTPKDFDVDKNVNMVKKAQSSISKYNRALYNLKSTDKDQQVRNQAQNVPLVLSKLKGVYFKNMFNHFVSRDREIKFFNTFTDPQKALEYAIEKNGKHEDLDKLLPYPVLVASAKMNKELISFGGGFTSVPHTKKDIPDTLIKKEAMDSTSILENSNIKSKKKSESSKKFQIDTFQKNPKRNIFKSLSRRYLLKFFE